MQRSASKRAQILKRALVYSAMTVVVVLMSTILVFLMLGYRFNKEAGTFQQGGLVQFKTRPDNARVTVGIAQLANRTPSKITLNPGNYQVKMELDGYDTWQKNIVVEAGKVLWLNSAIFIPSEPVTRSVLDLPKLSSMATRPDGEMVALVPEAQSPLIQLVNIDDDTIETENLTLSQTLFTAAKKHAFTAVSWAENDRFLLMRHNYGTKSEWLVVDTDDVTNSRRIGAQADVPAVTVRFDPSSSNRLYVLYADRTLRRFDVDSGNVSPVIARNVADFSLTATGVLLFSTVPADGSATIGYVSPGQATAREVESVPARTPVQVAGAKYFSKFYLAYSSGKQTEMLVLNGLPASDTDAPFASEVIAAKGSTTAVKELDFKAGGRLLAVQQTRGQQIYDNDLGVWYSVPIVGAKKDIRVPIQWLDGFHFWDETTGFLRQYEFDGSNQASIVSVASGFEAVYSQNGEYLYSIGRTKDGYSLQRTTMIIED